MYKLSTSYHAAAALIIMSQYIVTEHMDEILCTMQQRLNKIGRSKQLSSVKSYNIFCGWVFRLTQHVTFRNK